MSLRKYVRQLKPVQESYIAPETKVQTLLNEAQLKKADIFKRQNQTTFISLMMHTHSNIPCIDFLLEQIHQQYLLDGGLFAT